jgi:hypothetical protein
VSVFDQRPRFIIISKAAPLIIRSRGALTLIELLLINSVATFGSRADFVMCL